MTSPQLKTPRHVLAAAPPGVLVPEPAESYLENPECFSEELDYHSVARSKCFFILKYLDRCEQAEYLQLTADFEEGLQTGTYIGGQKFNRALRKMYWLEMIGHHRKLSHEQSAQEAARGDIRPFISLRTGSRCRARRTTRRAASSSTQAREGPDEGDAEPPGSAGRAHQSKLTSPLQRLVGVSHVAVDVTSNLGVCS